MSEQLLRLRLVLVAAVTLCIPGSRLFGQVVAEVGLGDAPAKVDTDEMAAAPTEVTAPIFGYLWRDDRQAFESIVGLPGAFSRGHKVNFSRPLRYAVSGVTGNRALGLAQGDGRVLLLNPHTAEDSVLSAISPNPDVIKLSPLGLSAGFLYQQTGTIEVLSHLDSAPAVSAVVDLSTVPGAASQWAVSDDGRSLLIAFSVDGRSNLYHLRAGEFLNPLFSRPSVSDIEFLPDSLEALVADGVDSAILHVSDLLGTPTAKVIAGPAQGIIEPQAVAVFPGDQRAVVVTNRTSSLAVLDLSIGSVDFVDCACRPTSLLAFASGGIFRLTDGAGSVALLANENGSPKVLMVAAPTLMIKTAQERLRQTSPRARTSRRP